MDAPDPQMASTTYHVPTTVILLIAGFSIVIIITCVILIVAIMRARARTETNFQEDLQMYEATQLTESHKHYTFQFSPRLGGYKLAAPPEGISPYSVTNWKQGRKGPNGNLNANANSGRLIRLWAPFGRKGQGQTGQETSELNGMPPSDSMFTIRVSPSSPVVFGSVEEEGGSGSPYVKVTVTPPTPAKERVFRAVLNSKG
ncbi:hypothetical protein DFP72DRAFT_180858 [Ephemerocybe angulata]|uniref:Uncharacterized protein n=1 Tax=Ephemerocybe angulata TaxID=980116 RepID=A0A8H6I519_9AGAR|nr:hypothetical protein DFP72DRAFT_180858 [Tulosesus angulatus]